MKNVIQSTLIMTASVLLLSADRAPAQQEYMATPAELRKSIIMMTLESGAAAKKINEMQEQMRALDHSVEARVNEVTKLLSSVKDSVESGTRVIHTKEQVLEGLKNSLMVYAQERDKLRNELEKPFRKMSAEDMARDIEALDRKIEERVDQIIKLTSSLTGDQGFRKYELHWDEGRGRRRGDGAEWDISDEYRQNQRVAGKTASEKEKLIEGLKKSIAHLEQQSEKLRSSLSAQKTQADWDGVETQIKKNDELIVKRQEQIRETLYAETPDTKSVGSSASHKLTTQVKEAVAKARTDFQEMLRLKNLIYVERSRVRWLNARVAIAKKQLAEAGE